MKIALHGFGTYPIVFRHLIEAARRSTPEIEWAMILPSPHHVELARAVLPAEDVFSLHDHLTRNPQPLADQSELNAYPGQIFADIEAEKRAFKHRPAWQQLARAAEIYRLYKDFLKRSGTSHLLIPQIEGLEGRMLPDIARELGIIPMVPTSGRIFAGTFFSADAHETLPTYRQATPALLDDARGFLAKYRQDPMSPFGIPDQQDPNDPRLDDFSEPVMTRAINFLRRNSARPDLFEREYVRISLLNNMPPIRDTLWQINKARGRRNFDIASLDQLPRRFIYYPLQVTPESSINTPAPYFVDQFRAIDAIRFAMPNDHLLVVKEHPSAMVTRPPSFVRSLQRRAGVAVARYNMDSRAIVERAALTISVTGTATLEAFMVGRPSLTLGPTFIAGLLGGVCPIDQLHTRIREKLARPPGDDLIVNAIAEIRGVVYDFVLRAPGYPGEPTLRRGNIDRMLGAILDHIARNDAPPQEAAP
jgi:hypothetical protein